MARDTSTPTQTHLPIAGIQDSVVIMNDASVRAVLKVEPINFELKSETEQNAVIYSYQAFLNSLDFPIQIVIHSKKLELERYLLHLQETQREISNELLRIQVEDYVGFVRRLISIANIMSKRFYVVVNYAAISRQSPLAGFTSILHRQATGPLLDQEQFERFRAEIMNRATMVGNGLSRLGLKVSLLNTQQLIELFYTIYNPDIATEERLTEVGDMRSDLVSAATVTPGSDEATEAAKAAAPTAPELNDRFTARVQQVLAEGGTLPTELTGTDGAAAAPSPENVGDTASEVKPPTEPVA